MTKIQLLLASNNPGKQREMQALLGDLGIELLLASDVGLELCVDESGASYAENAARKALAFCSAAGLPSLADDSGLEVDALGGEPGIRSARYAPLPQASDADRRAYLLRRLEGLPRPWRAHFHCTAALALPDGELVMGEGEVQGEVIPEARGQDGFGYDPIFLIPELGRTMAELTMQEKNRLSHRARAVQALRPYLIERLLGGS